MTEPTVGRRAAMLRRIGPHLATSDTRRGDEITGTGIAPGHYQWIADTACGQAKTATLVTRTRDRVRCPDCLTSMAADRLTPGGFPYRQAPHEFAGTSKERQEVGDPGHCEDCCSVGHIVAHPDLGCGDVGCNRDHTAADTFPYRIADSQNHGWLGDGEGNYHGFDPTWHAGRLLDKRPLADVVAEWGPVRPVEPPTDEDVAGLRAAFELAGRKLVTSIASAIEQIYHEARERPGGAWDKPDAGTTADYAQRTLTAGRPGSWEAEAIIPIMLFGNELNLWPYRSNVPVGLMRATGPNPKRVHIEARDAIATVLRRWVFSEDRYTELPETLAAYVSAFADEKHGADGWRRIADQWLQPGGLAVANFRACYSLLYSGSAHLDVDVTG